jgi:DNA-3-methyladenine glycosylase I
MPTRCPWVGEDELLTTYHDREWGVPEFDSRTLWESLMLSGFQAGLSWLTILRRREAFCKAFRGFDPEKVARFTEGGRCPVAEGRRHCPVENQNIGDDRRSAALHGDG